MNTYVISSNMNATIVNNKNVTSRQESYLDECTNEVYKHRSVGTLIYDEVLNVVSDALGGTCRKDVPPVLRIRLAFMTRNRPIHDVSPNETININLLHGFLVGEDEARWIVKRSKG